MDRGSESTPANHRLPTEIWHHIISFIPCALQVIRKSRLYMLNRTFLAYYLANQYGEVQLNSHLIRTLTPLQLNNYLDCLSYAATTQFIHTLRLYLQDEGYHVCSGSPQPTTHTRFMDTLRAKVPLLGQDGTKYKMERQKMLGCITSMNSLSEIDLHLIYPRLNQQIAIDAGPPFYLSLWQGSRTTLTCLKLTLHLKAVPDLGFSDILFPNLHDLHLRFSQCHPESYHNKELVATTRDTLFPFLLRHAGSIEMLSIGFPDTTASPADHEILVGMPCLRSLAELSIQCKIPRGDPAPGIVHLLSTHSPTVRRINLYLQTSLPPFTVDSPSAVLPGYKSHPIWDPPFPVLEALKCNISSWELMIRYISKFAPQLKMLVLPRTLTVEELTELSRALEVPRARAVLEKLDIKVIYLNSAILDLLSSQLPGLRHLRLTFAKLGPRYSDVDICEEIFNKIYGHWSLESLEFRPIYNDRDWRVQFRRAITSAFPNVNRFDGMTREQYLDNNSWHPCST